MDQFKPTIFTFATQRDLIHDKWRWQVRQVLLERLGPLQQIRLWHTPSQCHVKPELFKNIGISPLRQQVLLPRAQASFAPTGQLGLRRRRAKPVEVPHTAPGYTRNTFGITRRCQGKEPAKLADLQPVTHRRSKTSGKGSGRRIDIIDRAAIRQPKRRLQRAVKPVLARGRCGLTKTTDLKLGNALARDDIPAQPFRAKICQRSFGRHEINCKASV